MITQNFPQLHTRHKISQRARECHAKLKTQRQDGEILEYQLKEENPDDARERRQIPYRIIKTDFLSAYCLQQNTEDKY